MSAGQDDWGTAPHALGLTTSFGGTISGTWNGRVRVEARHALRGSVGHAYLHPELGATSYQGELVESSWQATEVHAILSPPLRLGLRARSRKATDGYGVADLDPRLGADPEQHFHLEAADREHARRVLAGPVMGEILRDAGAGAGGNLVLTDTEVSADLAMSWVVEPGLLGPALARVGRIAEALLAQRAALPAPWESGLHAGWAAVAARWSLAFDPRGPSLSGDVRGLFVEVVPRSSEPGQLLTEVRVSFARPLGVRLVLTRERSGLLGRLGGLIQKFNGPQDIRVGDPAFDDAFVIQGEPEHAVRALLGPEVRRRLLAACARFDTVSVGDQHLAGWVSAPVTAAEQLDALLRTALDAAAGLTGAAG